MNYYTKKTSLMLMILIILFVAACESGDSNRESDPDLPIIPTQCINDNFIDNFNVRETGTGVIIGSIVSSNSVPLNGVHVRAVNIDNTDLQISTYSGINTDLEIQNGAFSIQNIPEGTYRVVIEKMDSRAGAFQINRISDFLITNATTLNFPDEYWNGAEESDEDNPADFEPIVVTNGSTVNGIDIITNN